MSAQKIIKVGLNEGKKIRVKTPAGANISIIMDRETGGTTYLTENMTIINPGVTLQPSHSHVNIEEIVFVLEGEGEVWVDGKTCKIQKGDSVLFPANSKHTTRNTGIEPLVLLCFFSTPQYRKEGAYEKHDNVSFKEG